MARAIKEKETNNTTTTAKPAKTTRKKTGNISATEIKKIFNAQPKENVAEWEGKQLKIKQTLSMKDFVELSQVVTNSCFEDGEYRPINREFCTRLATVIAFSNVELPEDASEQFDILFGTDLYSQVISYLKPEVRFLLEDTIDSLIETEKEKINNVSSLLRGIIQGLDILRENFEGVTPAQISEMLKIATEENEDKEKLEIKA